MNLADLLIRQAEEQPFGIAVLRGRHMITFRQLDDAVWRLAAWLRRQGIAPGDVVGLTFRDEVRHLTASLALIRLGAVQITLPSSEPIVLRNATAKRAGVALVLTGPSAPRGLEAPAVAIDFDRIAASRDPIDPSVRSEGLASPYLLVLGSGTTGHPKLMAQTPDHYLKRLAVVDETAKIQPGERQLVFSPIDYSSVKRMRLDCLFSGGTSIYIDGPAENLLESSDRFGVDHLRLVVKQAEVLLRAVGTSSEGLRLPHLRSITIGSSTVGEPLRQAVKSRLSAGLVVAYATSETGPLCAALPADQDRYPGCVGRPAGGVEIRVVDADDRSLPPGEVGEIKIRAAGMISGYKDDPEATGRAFRDGWFYPRDLGSFTDDGVLIFHGRADDMMLLDGMNIFPREIENALEQHPQVTEALAFPVPHPMHQDVPVAAVVLSAPASEEDLLAFCRDRIGAHTPLRVLILPAIPDAARGKGLKRDLAQLFGFSRRPEVPE